jgi:hypothetical protein
VFEYGLESVLGHGLHAVFAEGDLAERQVAAETSQDGSIARLEVDLDGAVLFADLVVHRIGDHETVVGQFDDEGRVDLRLERDAVDELAEVDLDVVDGDHDVLRGRAEGTGLAAGGGHYAFLCG